MPSVESRVVIRAPLDRVYAVARDIERFPEFMDDVVEVEVVEPGDSRQVSRWVGRIAELNRNITWTEEDFWDIEGGICRFNQIQGDFTSYSGTWCFADDEEGTLVTLTVDYEYNVPLIGPLIMRLLHKKIQANCDSMLAALKAETEQG